MDNEQVIDRVQNLLLGMEERINGQFAGVTERFEKIDRQFENINRQFLSVNGQFETANDGIRLIDQKVESLRAEMTVHHKVIAPFIEWNRRIEDEVIRLSSELYDVKARLAKLENPLPQ